MYLSVFTGSFFTFWDLHLVPPLLIYWVFSVYPLSLSHFSPSPSFSRRRLLVLNQSSSKKGMCVCSRGVVGDNSGLIRAFQRKLIVFFRF